MTLAAVLAAVLAAIRTAHADNEDVVFLCARMASGELGCRIQLADLVSYEAVRLPDAVLNELACWGFDDAASACAEVRALAG